MQWIRSIAVCLFLFLFTSHAASANYELTYHCEGNSWTTCFIRFDGVIESGLAQHFERVLSEVDYPTIYLNSPGGDLGEALAVGRLIRRFGRDTAIGVSRDGDFSGQPSYAPRPDAGGICESACAYLFMGGVTRNLSEYPRFGSAADLQFSRIGFHRFFSQSDVLTSDDTQIASGLLIEYLVEMGIDARLFLAASQFGADEMYYLTEEDALNYGILLPTGFGPLTMEPYLDGVIAFSRRLDLPDQIRPHDHTTQITFFCEADQPRILLTSKWLGVADYFNDAAERNDPNVLSIGVPFAGGGKSLPTSWVHASESNQKTTLIVKFPDEQRHVLLKELEKEEFWINVFLSNAGGGDFGVNLELTQMDRAMIKSALSLCIR